MSHIRRIVGRCHVGDSHAQVLEYFKSRLRRGVWEKLTDAEREELTREVREAHDANREEYRQVMGSWA